MENQNSSKKIWLWAVVAVLVVLGWWLWNQQAVAPADDETALEQELNAVDLGNVEAELNMTDVDVNSL